MPDKLPEQYHPPAPYLSANEIQRCCDLMIGNTGWDISCESGQTLSEISEVIAAAFGPEYVAEVFAPRYDLAYWNKLLGKKILLSI